MSAKFDTTSKTPIANYLMELKSKNIIKPCKRLVLQDRFYHYFPICNENIAEFVKADNVEIGRAHV